MPRCIYCLETKPDELFNREHVIPEAFGKFENNLVLTCVCWDCNDFFSKELDLKLGRDAIEGIDRFRHGLKSPDEYKSMGKRSTSYHEVMEGPLKGLRCYGTPNADGGFDMTGYVPQIGLAQTDDGPFEYYLFDDLPTKDELTARGFVTPVSFQVFGATVEQGMDQLEKKGYPRGESGGQTEPFRGRARVDYVFKISHPEFRAMSKILMNYLASISTAGIACMPHFNEIREYVRYGKLPPRPLVKIVQPVKPIDPKTNQPVVAHYLALERRGDEVIGQVSLFSRNRYVVLLSQTPFALDVTLAASHVFDLKKLQVVRNPTLPPLE